MNTRTTIIGNFEHDKVKTAIFGTKRQTALKRLVKSEVLV